MVIKIALFSFILNYILSCVITTHSILLCMPSNLGFCLFTPFSGFMDSYVRSQWCGKNVHFNQIHEANKIHSKMICNDEQIENLFPLFPVDSWQGNLSYATLAYYLVSLSLGSFIICWFYLNERFTEEGRDSSLFSSVMATSVIVLYSPFMLLFYIFYLK